MRWVEVGLLRGSQLTPGAPWRILVTQADIERLTPTEGGRDWLSLKRALDPAWSGSTPRRVLAHIEDEPR